MFLKLAFRQIFKNRLFSFVNFTGLAIGLAFCFLTFIWYQFEHSYDRHYPTADRLFRMDYVINFTGSAFTLTTTPTPFQPLLKDFFPEIENSARLFSRNISLRVPGNHREFELENAYFADSTAQQIFGFEVLHGDPERALHTPFSIILTDKSAERFFGSENVLGEQVLLANQGPFTVGAVVRSMPENAHFQFDFIAPFKNIPDVEPEFARENVRNVLVNNKLASYANTYILLRPGADPAAVNARFKDFIQKNGIPEMRDKQDFKLISVRDIHLKSEAQDEPVPAADPNYLKIFALIGLLILGIACINFVNLSTAAQLSRGKEVGVRKVLGSGKWQVIRQMLGETFLLGLPAFFTALVLVKLFLPKMAAFFGRTPDFSFSENWGTTALFFGIFVVACLLAGIYPAIFASKFRAVDMFRGATGGSGKNKNWLAKTLMTLQFTVAVALLAGTGIILKQLDFLKNRPLGFDREMVLGVPLFSPNINSNFSPGDQNLRNRTNAFEEKLLQNPKISAVTMASALPGTGAVNHPFTTDKIKLEDGVVLPAISVDYDFLKIFGLKIIAGRDFDKSFGTDHISGYIVNQEACKSFGWATPEEALGQNISRGAKGNRDGKVVGVVNDFNAQSLRTGLQPLILEVSPGMFTRFAIKIAATDVGETQKFIENTWRESFPEKVFECSFLDQTLADAYAEDNRFAKLIALFAAVAIFLSCFGLFGMIAFAVRQRTKEIGIRKVLGASVASVVGLLSKDFLKLVSVSILLGSPVAYFFMKKWLADFHYRIDLGLAVFLMAGLLAVAIAFLTIGFQSFRAAVANPTDSLRSE